MERLVLIDGNAILHRAYHALPEWRNKEGEATNGVYGFFSMLIRVKEEFSPHYLVVAFDHPGPTFRHNLYVGYQHGRTKDRQVEEDIWGQVEKLKEWLGRVGVAVFQLEGFEADDVIGTLSRQSTKVGEVIVVTGDRDLLQLVDKKTKVFMPIKGLSEAVLLDEEGVLEKMGVSPNLIVDYKALVGDSSDNYPGVPGIGPVTATKLIGEYGGVEKIYKNLGKIEEKVAKKLAEGHEGAMVSRELAIIRRDAPITLDLSASRMPDDEKLVWLFGQMNYPSLVKRVTGESEEAVTKKTKKEKKLEGQMELV